MKYITGCIIFTLVLLSGVGCSNEISPTEPIQVTENIEDLTWRESSHNLLGLFTFVCDPEAGAIDIIPIRGAELHLNALKFLEPPPYVLLTLESPVKITGNILDIDIGLRNPYPGALEYTGFDVCGIVFTHGSESVFDDPALIMAGEGDARLLNADGFTRWWNPSEFPHGDKIFNYIDGLLGTPAGSADFNCTYNGYKYFADELEKDDPLTMLDPANRGMFSCGQKNVRHYTLDISGGLIFNYAVDACWKKLTGGPPYTVPDDFPPGANREEAYNVEMTEISNNLYYVDNTYLIGGELSVRIDVWDHFNAGLNEVYAYSPSGLPIDYALMPVGGGAGYSTYELDFDGENLIHNGEAELYIAVESNAVGYGGALPGEPVCAVFKRTFYISPDAPPGWALTWGESDWDEANDVAVDSSDSIYVCGGFGDIVDFDPGPGVCEETGYGHINGFISKFNSNAVFQWVLIFQGNEYVWCDGIAVDSLNNIYLTGHFEDVVDLDPGDGVNEHLSNGLRDAFLCKLDENGLFQWAGTLGGIGQEQATGIAVDSFDNIYVTGMFEDVVDFDPGPGEDIRTNFSQAWGAFLSKFDPEGNYQYTRVWGVEDLPDTGGAETNAVAVDGADDVYVTGGFWKTVDFDPGDGVCEYTSVDKYDAYISKFDSSGNFAWAYAWGADEDDNGNDIACDGMSAVFVTGSFLGTVDFDPGPGVDEHTGAPDNRSFVCKYLPDGTYQWTIVPVSYRGDSGVVVDNNHNIFANDGVSGFFTKFNEDGVFQWDHQLGCSYGFESRSCIDGGNSSYSAGRFSGNNIDFEPGDGVDYHSADGLVDAFLMKLTSDGTW